MPPDDGTIVHKLSRTGMPKGNLGGAGGPSGPVVPAGRDDYAGRLSVGTILSVGTDTVGGHERSVQVTAARPARRAGGGRGRLLRVGDADRLRGRQGRRAGRARGRPAGGAAAP